MPDMGSEGQALGKTVVETILKIDGIERTETAIVV